MAKDYDPKNPRTPYEQVMDEAMKPHKSRKAVVKTRAGSMVAPRRHSMPPEKALEGLKEFKKSGKFPNPYRANGKYWAFIEAMAILGLDKAHKYAMVRDKMKELLSQHQTSRGVDGWQDFEEPQKRNAAATKDVRGRILQNAIVLQRLKDNNPYGYKLAQLHSCVDILADDNGLPMFRLRTGIKSLVSVEPINELRKRKRSIKPAAKPAASAKPAVKPAAAAKKKVAKKAGKKAGKKAPAKKKPQLESTADDSPDNK